MHERTGGTDVFRAPVPHGTNLAAASRSQAGDPRSMCPQRLARHAHARVACRPTSGWLGEGGQCKKRAVEMNATERWKQALTAWAIPPAILAAAPESPW